MKRIYAIIALLILTLSFFSCNAPVREFSDSSDDGVTVNDDTDRDMPVLSTTTATEEEPEDIVESTQAQTTAAETTGVPETTESVETTETTVIPPLRIEPAETTAGIVMPDTEETTSYYTTEVPDTLPATDVGKHPVILMYHCVADEPTTPNTSLFVRPSEFEDQAKAIVENGINTLFADEFGEVEETSVILTFDDGYEDNYTNMFPILKKYNIKATVYMIAYKIDSPGYLTKAQIKEMSDSGLVQFGSHTLDHPELSRLCEADIRAQLEGSKWLISQVTGKPVTTLAYPSGKYNALVMNIAAEMYSFACTTDDDPYRGQDPMALPRYAILRGETGRSFLRFIL